MYPGLSEHWTMLVNRIHGPFAFRFVLQPLVAAIIAARSGIRDARAGRSPHLWRFVFDASARPGLLRETWKDVGKVFLAAIAIDLIYQIIVHSWIYAGQTLVVSLVLAFASYILVRGPTNRIVRLWMHRRKAVDAGAPDDRRD